MARAPYIGDQGGALQHYHRTSSPMLMGDDAAVPSVVENTAATAVSILDQPIVKTGIMAAATYHGYRRTGSLLWAVAYGLAARVAPITTGAVVAAQGFGDRKGT